MIGLESGKVMLAPYSEEWKKLYVNEKKLLKEAIGDLIIDIQHVGSTSIPGLIAKPIIDIAVGVNTLEIGEKCIIPLEQIGYEYKHDAGIPGRHFFVKGSKDCRTFYLHLEQINSQIWKNHIYFRDFLEMHYELAVEYASLKAILADKYKNDRETYTLEKSAFIQNVLEKAEKEFGCIC